MEFNSKGFFLDDFGKNLALEKSHLYEEEFHKFLSLSPKKLANTLQAGSSNESQTKILIFHNI